MGGTLEERGNTTETGEWNACVDPEAVEICLRAGSIHRVMPLDATQDVVFTIDDLDALPDTPLAGIVRDAIRFYVEFHRKADGIDGAYLHDPVALIGSLLEPRLVTESVTEILACDTSADPYLAGSLYRTGGETTARPSPSRPRSIPSRCARRSSSVSPAPSASRTASTPFRPEEGQHQPWSSVGSPH